MSLLESLVIVSEKAANIARACRKEECLFELLIQEKSEDESNPRFLQDFKTLADVLIQETVKYEIGRKFPELKDSIKGEEDNKFCNTLGDSISIEIRDTTDATTELLSIVLNGNKAAGSLLSKEVYRTVDLKDVNTKEPPHDDSLNLELEQLGIWIDPIDCTNEYIKGADKKDVNGVYTSGLHCVTVLIGVYNKINGKPIIGVINQPFYEKRDNNWRGKCFWGSTLMPAPSSSLDNTEFNATKTVSISCSESALIKDKLRRNGYKLMEASGAGYKILTVINGTADVYLLTKNSTFMWDTCGPQAILKALNGDILIYDEIAKNNETPINYKDDPNRMGSSKIDACCNVGGILAYRNKEILDDLRKIL